MWPGARYVSVANSFDVSHGTGRTIAMEEGQKHHYLVGVDAIIDGALEVIQQLVGGCAQHDRGHSPSGSVLLQAHHQRAADLLGCQ